MEGQKSSGKTWANLLENSLENLKIEATLAFCTETIGLWCRNSSMDKYPACTSYCMDLSLSNRLPKRHWSHLLNLNKTSQVGNYRRWDAVSWWICTLLHAAINAFSYGDFFIVLCRFWSVCAEQVWYGWRAIECKNKCCVRKALVHFCVCMHVCVPLTANAHVWSIKPHPEVHINCWSGLCFEVWSYWGG